MKIRGFTLLEVMIAIAIMSSGILLLSTSWSGSQVRIRKTQLITEVSTLLERKMVEVEAEFSGKPLDSIPEEKSDDFGSDLPLFSWKMESRKLEIPDLSGLIARQSGDQPPDPMLQSILKALSEHISKSVKEVKVTVTYKGGKKPLEYSATQYFVDYDKEIPLPGAGGALPQ